MRLLGSSVLIEERLVLVVVFRAEPQAERLEHRVAAVIRRATPWGLDMTLAAPMDVVDLDHPGLVVVALCLTMTPQWLKT